MKKMRIALNLISLVVLFLVTGKFVISNGVL